MANPIIDALTKYILSRPEVKTQFNQILVKDRESQLEAAKKVWAEETTKALAQQSQRRQFITVSGQTISGKELQTGKNWSTLYTLYSNAPGSVQCADRIREAVLGGGYVLEAVKGQKGTQKELKELIKFFDQPNPDETIEDLVGGGLIKYLEYGNWYMEKVLTKKGSRLAELYNLDPTKVKILVDDEKKKKGVEEKVGYQRETELGKKVNYSTNEVVHIRRPDPRGKLYGQAVLETNEATLQLLIQALTYNINILKNGGRPPLQLILPDDSTEADAEAVNAFWEKNYTGPANAGKTLITFKGAKAQALGVSPEEMKYLALLAYGIRQVSGQYGVPLILIGTPEGTNRATAAETRRAFYLTKIYPMRKAIAQKITTEVIVKGFGITGWKLDFRSAGLEESDASRRDTILAWSKGLYNWNEARVKMGMLPIDEAWASKYYLLGTKNDSLVEMKDAVDNVSSDANTGDDNADNQGKPKKKPNGSDPESPAVKPTEGQGSGADNSDE